MSALQLGVHSTQINTTGTLVLTVHDSLAEVQSVGFHLTDASGARTPAPVSASRVDASAGVYERDVARPVAGTVQIEALVTLTDGRVLEAGSEWFDARPAPEPAPQEPAISSLVVTAEYGILNVSIVPRTAATWACWVRRGAWPTADNTPGGRLLHEYLRFEGTRERSSFATAADSAGSDWYVVAVGYDHLGTAGRRLADSVAATYGDSVRPALRSAPVFQLDGVEQRKIRVAEDMQGFANWLAKYEQRGFYSETGWPEDDATAWNEVGRHFYRIANEKGLWIAAWATGEMWGDAYRLQPYKRVGGVWTAMPQAAVMEEAANLHTAAVKRGVNVAGAEFASPVNQPRVNWFSNQKPGVHGTEYLYNGPATYAYLRGRGMVLARIPFRWERIQPALGAVLDAAELQRLRDSVNAATAAGMEVVLDVHNYGAYYLHDAATGDGVRRSIGTPEVTEAHFRDLWARLAQEFNANPGVIGYGLMNEPVDMEGTLGRTPEKTWAAAAQAATDGIRSVPLPAGAEPRWIVVGGYNWSHSWALHSDHGEPFITDPAERVIYEAHLYYDRDRTGRYLERELNPVHDGHWVRWDPNPELWRQEDLSGNADTYTVRLFRRGELTPVATAPLWWRGITDEPVYPCTPGTDTGCAHRAYEYRVVVTDQRDGSTLEYAAGIQGNYK